MRLLERVDVAELDVGDIDDTARGLQLDDVIWGAFIMELNVPGQAAAFVTRFAAEPDQCIELNTDCYIPLQSGAVELEPHLVEGVHAVDGDVFVVDGLHFLKDEGEVVQTGQHYI